ncbi:hypothetical protein PRUPE_7G024600 [Prunus persica]|uniref:Magnesium chelatase subunit H N-terminal domain-containing protein n=1 Tax=Prunus persica TaxID=3760 RepID=M5VRQ7_PRUPE|nr:hypothetical protein PRUPE_7G024600 [Prunus persica]
MLCSPWASSNTKTSLRLIKVEYGEYDLENANIFIGSSIFVEEHAIKVWDAVEKETNRLDAVFFLFALVDSK